MNYSIYKRAHSTGRTCSISRFNSKTVEGDKTYDVPVTVAVIWSGKQMTIHDERGDEVISSQQLFIDFRDIGFTPSAADLFAVDGVNATPLAVKREYAMNVGNADTYVVYL